MITYGIILAAGKQSRFNSPTPKALVQFNENSTLLKHNYDILEKYCEKVYVVTSLENNHFFEKYLNETKLAKIELISIESGLGDGDAVLKFLNKIEYKIDDRFILCWGDSIQKNYYIDTSLPEIFKHHIIVPVHFEKNPYVLFKTNNQSQIKKVLFSKYNEIDCEDGLHDLSLFIFNAHFIKFNLEMMRKKFYNEENKNYDCRNGELIFLDLFNETEIDNTTVFINLKDEDQLNSFNTLEEYKKIIDGK